MKNADLPAMPLSGDAYQDFAAYDETGGTSYNPECQGLTKREMFAMNIMASISATSLEDCTRLLKATGKGDIGEMYAGMAVEYADALLKELEK